MIITYQYPNVSVRTVFKTCVIPNINLIGVSEDDKSQLLYNHIQVHILSDYQRSIEKEMNKSRFDPVTELSIIMIQI